MVIKGVTIAKDEYKRLQRMDRKYALIVFAITDPIYTMREKIDRIDEITEDSYKFKKGE